MNILYACSSHEIAVQTFEKLAAFSVGKIFHSTRYIEFGSEVKFRVIVATDLEDARKCAGLAVSQILFCGRFSDEVVSFLSTLLRESV